jgi:hypothetical protein
VGILEKQARESGAVVERGEQFELLVARASRVDQETGVDPVRQHRVRVGDVVPDG